MSLFDSHTHLATAAFAADLSETLHRARQAGVTEFISIGSGEGFASNEAAVALAEKESDIWATLGIHPHDAKIFSPAILADVVALKAKSKRAVAWGEIGLDYHYMHADVATQKNAFIEQIHAAHALALPLIIHTREAEADTLAILKEYRSKISEVIVHCFTGTPDFGKDLDAIGAFIGVGGVFTFRNAEALRQTITAYPLERILLETDCPYLAPVPYRGKRNEPAYVAAIAAKLGEIKGLAEAAVSQTTTDNARRFFALST